MHSPTADMRKASSHESGVGMSFDHGIDLQPLRVSCGFAQAQLEYD